MIGTINQHLAGVPDVGSRHSIRIPMRSIGARLSSQTLTSGALAIKTGGSALARTTALWVGTVSGALGTKVASDMAALVGTVTNARFNVYSFFIDRAGNLTSAMGAESTTLAGVMFPQLAEGAAQIGFVIINPTGTGNFVGGTTPLDDATVVPNAVYVNTVGAFDATVLPA